MNKGELTARTAIAAGVPVAVVERVINALTGEIGACVAVGETVSLRGFGTFERRTRAARTARNPRTNMPVPTPATQVVKFRPSKTLKDAVANG